MLERQGFGPIHEVIEFFHPGITDTAVCLVADSVTAEVIRQMPQILTLGPCRADNLNDYRERGLALLGTVVELEGSV